MCRVSFGLGLVEQTGKRSVKKECRACVNNPLIYVKEVDVSLDAFGFDCLDGNMVV
jgi:hypothetical protein